MTQPRCQRKREKQLERTDQVTIKKEDQKVKVPQNPEHEYTECNHLFLGPLLIFPENVTKIHFSSYFAANKESDRPTDRQACRQEKVIMQGWCKLNGCLLSMMMVIFQAAVKAWLL